MNAGFKGILNLKSFKNIKLLNNYFLQNRAVAYNQQFESSKGGILYFDAEHKDFFSAKEKRVLIRNNKFFNNRAEAGGIAFIKGSMSLANLIKDIINNSNNHFKSSKVKRNFFNKII